MENFGTLLGRIDALTAEKRALLRDMEGMSWLPRERAAGRVTEIEAQLEACYVAMRASRAEADAVDADPLAAERRAYTRRVFGHQQTSDEDPASPPTAVAAPAPAPMPAPAAVATVAVRTLRAPKRDWLALSGRARAAS